MGVNQRSYKNQVKINDLIDDAVNNAVARRHQVIDSQDALSALSDEEAGSIAGGSVLGDIIYFGGYLLGLPPKV